MSQDLSDYVYLDAKERAYEIEIEARKEYESKKDDLVEKKTKKLEDEFKKKIELKEVQKRIEHSNLINRTRTSKLLAKNKAILKLLNHTQLSLIEKIKDAKFYQKLMGDIILEGLFKLLEEKVFIRCLQRDVQMIKGLLGDITKQFKKLILEELGEEPKLELLVDETKFLQLREVPDFSKCKFEEFTEELERKIKIDKKDEMLKCFGGVILINASNDIICKSTLDVRVQQGFADYLPDIRERLFAVQPNA